MSIGSVRPLESVQNKPLFSRMESLRNEIAELVRGSKVFPRSRKELVRRILDDPAMLVPTLIGMGSEALGSDASTIMAALKAALKQSPSPRLVEPIRKAITLRPVYFSELGISLTETLLQHEMRSKSRNDSRAAALLHRLADLHGNADHPEKAIACSRAAVKIYRRLSKKGEPVLTNHAVALLGLVEHLEAAGQFPPAVRTGYEAVRITREGATRDVRRIHALALCTLGTALSASGKTKEALLHLEDGYRRLRKLKRMSRSEQSNYAHAAAGLAGVYVQLQDFTRAAPLADEAFTLHAQLVADDPGSVLVDYLSTALILSLVAAKCGSADRAKSVREESAHYVSTLAKSQPETYGIQMVWHLTHIAGALFQEDRLDEALPWSTRASKSVRSLRENQDIYAAEAHAFTLLTEAAIWMGFKKRRKAERCAAEAIEAATSLPPDHVERDQLLAECHKLMEVLGTQPSVG